MPKNNHKAINPIFSEDSNYALFVEKNFKHYAEKWSNLIEKKKLEKEVLIDLYKFRINKISFNLCAFLFTFVWCAYRKMYLLSIFALIAGMFLEYIHPFASLIELPLFGMYADLLYFRFAKHRIDELEKKFINSENLRVKIIESGSTSIVGLALSSLAPVLIQAFFLAFSQHLIKSQISSIELKELEANVGKLSAILAGEKGEIEWDDSDFLSENQYYIRIKQNDEEMGYLRFSYNENTDYIFLSSVKFRNKFCSKSESISCIRMWLASIKQ